MYSFTCCLFLFETWFLILREECRLRAFNDSVIRKLNPSRDEVKEWWMKLLNS